MRILVADDEPTGRAIAEATLRAQGHDCTAVADGQAAWASFQQHRPDVVISDWMMPGMSGLELCRRIRATPGPYPYFIMVTGRGAAAAVLEGMNAGADDYLVKPLDGGDLEARLVAAARVTGLHHSLAEQRHDLEVLNGELTTIARRDPLTGLWNRRALDEDLATIEARVFRYGHSYALGILDVDHFKSYNDELGHQAGDEILRSVATALALHARSGDALYRYGGEEFLYLLPEQTIASATWALERMRAAIERLTIPHPGACGVLTISAGVAVLDPTMPTSAAAALHRADGALYRAKELGRNRVEQAPIHQFA